LHRLPAGALVVLLLLSVIVALVTRAVESDQEDRLLVQRANEVSLVLETSISSLETTMTGLGLVARDGGTALFTKEAARDVATGPGELTFALLRREHGSYVVVVEAGHGLSAGEVAPAPVAAVLAAAQKGGDMVATPVLGSGRDRLLGFALGGSSEPPGMVLYRQSALGPVKAPRDAGTAPFHELRAVLYDDSRPVPAQVVVTTTKDLPLVGRVRYSAFPVGASHWLLAVSSPQPLVGTLAAWAPWLALAVGMAASALIAATLEQVVRRRDAAVALYRSEHHVAETLQHRLLPTLAAVPGLDVASRYVAASDSQQVGGDWFDVFDLGGGRTAVVIGDVMGHDIEAAAAMAQVRAALRAYALENDEPAPVLERLAHLVDAFDVTALVTVIYGVLGPPTSDGARQFRWANAGHLPPLVRAAEGEVHELDDGRSKVIGAPGRERRGQGQALLPTGSSLVLYTDGLVERPGTALSDSIEQLRSSLQHLRTGTSADELCEAALVARPMDQTRDDIAMVVIRLLPGVVAGRGPRRSNHPADNPGPIGSQPGGTATLEGPSGQRATAERSRSGLVVDSNMAYDVVPSLAVLYRQHIGEGVDHEEASARLDRASGAAKFGCTTAGWLTTGDDFDRDPGVVIRQKDLDVLAAIVDHTVAHELGHHQ
jgi:serine phosphatase RsbU (regulator of sigma subunit)